MGQVNAFNFTTDDKQFVYICIAAISYPERLVFPLLNELSKKFVLANEATAKTCGAGELSKKTNSLFSQFVTEYDDPTKKDKLSSVKAKVEGVKLTMHNNIDGMLRNLDQTEQVERTTAKLHEQARMFETNAGIIKRQEQWKNMKLTLIIGGIAVIILILIFVSLFN